MPDRNLFTRRELLKRTAATAGTLAVPMLNRGRYRMFVSSPTTYSARTVDLMKRATVIEMQA